MGGLNILITGANGFLGQEVTRCAIAKGHRVIGLVRRDGRRLPKGVEPLCCDLADPCADLKNTIARVDVVVHLSAALGSDWAVHERDTILATQNLLHAIKDTAMPPALVHLSSIAAHAYDASSCCGVISDQTPLEPHPGKRDNYAAAKLAQENLVAKADLTALRILRPGAIYGPDRLWNAHIGPIIGPLLLRFGKKGDIPLVSLRSCADAIVAAAEIPFAEQIEAYNLVDDDLPDRRRFLAACGYPSFVLPFPWHLLHLLARLIPVNTPSLLQAATVRARFMPVCFDNTAAKQALGWVPVPHFETAFAAAKEASS